VTVLVIGWFERDQDQEYDHEHDGSDRSVRKAPPTKSLVMPPGPAVPLKIVSLTVDNIQGSVKVFHPLACRADKRLVSVFVPFHEESPDHRHHRPRWFVPR
jgi:hypothetical protein